MATEANIIVPDGYATNNPVPLDFYGKYDAVDEATAVALALTSIPLVLRFKGRSALCNGVEYRFVDGTSDVDFVKYVIEALPATLQNYADNGILDQNTFSENGFNIGKKVADSANNEYDLATAKPSTTSANFVKYKSIRANIGGVATSTLTYCKPVVVENTFSTYSTLELGEIKNGIICNTFNFWGTNGISQNTSIDGTSKERGQIVVNYSDLILVDKQLAPINMGIRNLYTQKLDRTITNVSRASNVAIITSNSHGYSANGLCQIVNVDLGLPKASNSLTQISCLSNVLTFTTSTTHTYLVGDIVLLNSTAGIVISTRGFYIKSVTSNTFTVEYKNADLATTATTGTVAHHSWYVISSVTTNTITINNCAGPDVASIVSTGSIIAPKNYVINATGNSPSVHVGKFYFGTSVVTPTLTAIEVLKGATNTWGYYASDVQPSYFGRNGHFGNTLLTVPNTTATDINVWSEGAIRLGNTTTGTPIDGILSKIANGDLNYVAGTVWRGLLHVLGDTGANVNIVTNTANAILKFVGTGLQAIGSLLLDNGNTLSYTGIGGISLLRNTRYSTVAETPIVTSATPTNLLTIVPNVTYKAPLSGAVTGGNVFTIADILNTDVTKRLKIEFGASSITGFATGSTITICFGTAGTDILGTFTIPTLNAGVGEVLSSVMVMAELIIKTTGGSGTGTVYLDGIASFRSAGATGGGNAYTYTTREIQLTQTGGTFNTAQTNILMIRATTPGAGSVTVSKYNLIVNS